MLIIRNAETVKPNLFWPTADRKHWRKKILTEADRPSDNWRKNRKSKASLVSYLTTQRGKRLQKFENCYYTFRFTKIISEHWRFRLRSGSRRVKMKNKIVSATREHKNHELDSYTVHGVIVNSGPDEIFSCSPPNVTYAYYYHSHYQKLHEA